VLDERPLVLVVEDDADIRTLHACILDARGFAVATAANGEAALAALDQLTSPCAVLIDLRMPKMDGAQLLACLRAHPHRANIPVAIVTAEPERAQGFGCPVFGKPVHMAELLAFVQSCAARLNARAAL
jgi:two-component system phosphate regulon response regulator PhoB